jgi:predicted DNA-binding transcriptional regulator AlpA
MNNLRTLGIDEISALLHLSRNAVYIAVSRNPQKLPPRLKIPGNRKLLWLESDVIEWLEICRVKQGGKPRSAS